MVYPHPCLGVYVDHNIQNQTTVHANTQQRSYDKGTARMEGIDFLFPPPNTDMKDAAKKLVRWLSHNLARFSPAGIPCIKIGSWEWLIMQILLPILTDGKKDESECSYNSYVFGIRVSQPKDLMPMGRGQH